MDIIRTIPHTGTLSLRAHLKYEPEIYHFDEPVPLHKRCYTTYRDPYRTAASWANRGELDLVRWENQWTEWVKALPGCIVVLIGDIDHHLNAHADSKGLHAALNAGDHDAFHDIVPVEYIKIAWANIKDTRYAH